MLTDLAEGTYRATIEGQREGALQLGISQAPSIFFNDFALPQATANIDVLDGISQAEILKRSYPVPPPPVVDPANDYVAWIVTEKGTIAVDLFAGLAPQTVNNFAYLACAGYFNDITWHRVLPTFVAQTGDPTATGFGGPAYSIPDEFRRSDLRFDREGLLSMAHTGQPDSANGQWFITLRDTPNLNNAFTIFGEVREGLDVVESLTPRDQSQASTLLPPGDTLITVIVRQTPEE
ncbi:MAG: peptidylprolyl isomerase [Chloroflexi bacterium]|nr:peptidylprolyl isomerase [Chloroflexota bacterium]